MWPHVRWRHLGKFSCRAADRTLSFEHSFLRLDILLGTGGADRSVCQGVSLGLLIALCPGKLLSLRAVSISSHLGRLPGHALPPNIHIFIDVFFGTFAQWNIILVIKTRVELH